MTQLNHNPANDLANLAEKAIFDDNYSTFQDAFRAGKVNFRHNIVVMAITRAEQDISSIGYFQVLVEYWGDQFKRSYPQFYEEGLALQVKWQAQQEAKILDQSTSVQPSSRHTLKTRL